MKRGSEPAELAIVTCLRRTPGRMAQFGREVVRQQCARRPLAGYGRTALTGVEWRASVRSKGKRAREARKCSTLLSCSRATNVAGYELLNRRGREV